MAKLMTKVALGALAALAAVGISKAKPAKKSGKKSGKQASSKGTVKSAAKRKKPAKKRKLARAY